MKPPTSITETGWNRRDDMDIARELIMVAAPFCRVDGVSYQKRNPGELVSEEQNDAPHPNPMQAYVKTHRENRELLELKLDQHRRLKKWC